MAPVNHLTICWLLLIIPTVVLSQDKLYMGDEARQGKIMELTFNMVKFSPADKPSPPLFLPTSKILLLFNAKGDYLVPGRLDSSDARTNQRLAGFLRPADTPRVKDRLYTIQNTFLETTVVREDSQYIYLPDTVRMDKRDMVALIYHNGAVKLFAPASIAATVLADAQAGLLKVAPIPGSNSADNPGNISLSALIGQVPRKEFEDKAEKKTRQFTDYLRVLCDKNADHEELNKAISQALTLFVNENAMVETSSNNRNNISRQKIRSYLNRVKMIQYDKIEISWTHVQYVSDLKPGPDGNFYGQVSFEQEFKGYKDGKLVYSDVTYKNATVVLKTYDKSYEGTTQKIWDVLLSDVGVVGTK